MIKKFFIGYREQMSYTAFEDVNISWRTGGGPGLLPAKRRRDD